jgi:23S rRNA pseudouridine1911/1915/1917 synthase
MRTFKVSSSGAGQRADFFIASKYPDYTRSALAGLFYLDKVKINGEFAKPGYKLKPEDNVKVDDGLLKQKPDKINLPVLYEDDDVIVIDKPAGVLTHSKGGLNLEPTVASFIEPKIEDKNLTGNRAGIVHRLDRATSGVIIAAKNQDTLKMLQRQFSGRKVKKTYWAVVEGTPHPKEAIINSPIARNPHKPQTFMVSAAGKPALTQYKVLRTINRVGNTYSLLELLPQTGRTHQLRVHLAYIGHPIVGDRLYGHGQADLLLYAKSLEINLPSGRRAVFEAGPPAHFKEFISD